MSSTPQPSRPSAAGLGLPAAACFYLIFGGVIGLCLYGDIAGVIYSALILGVLIGVLARRQRSWRETTIPGMLLGIFDVVAVAVVLLALAASGDEVDWTLRCVIGSGIGLATGIPFWFLFERNRTEPTAERDDRTNE